MATRILIVEDERLIALDLELILKGFGFQVVGVASSCEEALLAVQDEKPDLLLMDIKLRGAADGVETARKITKQLAIPVVYLSAYSDKATVRRAKLDVPFIYLYKPFDQVKLYESIQSVLNK